MTFLISKGGPRDFGLEYVGVVLIDGKSCALLRTRDNPTPQPGNPAPQPKDSRPSIFF